MADGRCVLMTRIGDLIDSARAGQGGSIVVEGVAGVGKTTLLDVVERTHDIPIIRVTGTEFERAMPLAGVTLLCAPLIAVADRLGTHQAAIVRGALGLDGSTSPATSNDVMALGLAIVALLAEAARPDGLCVIIDDAQWLDPTTVLVVEFVARRLGGTHVALVGAQRPTDDGLTCGGAIEIGLLSNDESTDMMTELGVDSGVARTIAAAVDGLPLLLRHIVDQLTPRQRTGLAALPDPLPFGDDLESEFADLVRRLDDDERHALLLLAALGHGQHLHDIDPSATVHFGRAETLAIVTLGTRGAQFAHPIIRSAVYWSASPDERRRVHREIADALDPSVDAEVWHRAAAAVAPDDLLAERLIDSGRRTARRGAHASAISTFQRAAEIARSDLCRSRALVAGAQAALASGATTIASAFLTEAGRIDPDLATDELSARVAFEMGDPVVAQRGFATAAEKWRSIDDERSAAAVVEQVLMSLRLHDVATAATCLAAMPPCSDRLRTRAGILDAVLRCRTGAPGELGRVRDELARLRCSSADVDDLRFIVEAVTLALAGAGDDPVLRELADDLHRSVGDVVPSVVPSLLLARAAYCARSDLTGTATAARQAIELAEESGQHGLVSLALPWLANAQAGLGDPECPATCDAVAALGGDPAWVAARSAMGFHALTMQQPDIAFAALDELHRWSGGEVRSMILWHADLAESALAIGRRDCAGEQLAILEGLEAAGDWPWVRGVAHRVRGQMSTDNDDAIEELSIASRALHGGGFVIAGARTDLMLAERLRRARRRAQARTCTHRARHSFERAGMTVWIARCDEELHKLGDSAPPSLDVEAHATLTTQELQIARWVTAGDSNRDVARRLVLSPRTVESHLSAIYRKLGVSGRTQLIIRSRADLSLSG